VFFSVSCDLGMGTIGQASEYNSTEKKVFWKIKKFGGGTEQTLRVKVIPVCVCLCVCWSVFVWVCVCVRLCVFVVC